MHFKPGISMYIIFMWFGFFALPVCNGHHQVVTFNALGIRSKIFTKLMATRLDLYALMKISYICEQKENSKERFR